MAESSEVSTESTKYDWRLSLGLGVTVFWLALGLLYIANIVGWLDFVTQSAPELGGFLEGAFAPLAFLWLVIGFFLQQHQLSENTLAIRLQYEALQRTAEQAEIQSRAIAANELHARQDTFMDVARMVSNQLGVISGYQWMSSRGEELESDAIADLWTQLGQGDHATFSRLLIAATFRNEADATELFWSTPIRIRHSENFIQTFERLVASAEGCDSDGMIADAIRAEAHGRVYQFMMDTRGVAPTAGGTPA